MFLEHFIQKSKFFPELTLSISIVEVFGTFCFVKNILLIHNISNFAQNFSSLVPKFSSKYSYNLLKLIKFQILPKILPILSLNFLQNIPIIWSNFRLCCLKILQNLHIPIFHQKLWQVVLNYSQKFTHNFQNTSKFSPVLKHPYYLLELFSEVYKFA